MHYNDIRRKSAYNLKFLETVSPYTLSCIPDYLFIGSRLGDSVLLHYSCESKKTSANCTNHEPQTKKIQLDANTSSADDDFLYGFGELPAAKETVCLIGIFYYENMIFYNLLLQHPLTVLCLICLISFIEGSFDY